MSRLRILATGFSAFPGARQNPTETLLSHLDVKRLNRRFGIEVVTEILPANYAAVAQSLPRLWQDVVPDAAIHFGLNGRARAVHVERRAVNHATRIRPDAIGARLSRPQISASGPRIRRASLPVERIRAAIIARGVPARLSNDAGGYVCNYASYLSLKAAPTQAMSGFVHLPWPAEIKALRAPADRPSWDALAVAVEEAIGVVGTTARVRRRARV